MATLYSVKSVNGPIQGLTDEDVVQRRARSGSNSLPDISTSPLKNALSKFWAPVPWMLEVAILIQLFLGEYAESAIIVFLLIFNAALGYFQEASAQKTLALLKLKLALNVTVMRNSVWIKLLASELVSGDLIKLTLGDVVPADVKVVEGLVQVDQSVLTGESMPIEVGVGMATFAGVTVQRGEAKAEVITTGANTKFGRTAELVQTAHSVSSQQVTVMHVVRNLAIFNGCVIIFMMVYANLHGMNHTDSIHLMLTAILASIPVALPATFTLAAAIGAKALAKKGVLPTRLSAVEEAASMDVLCSDKTGTLTNNALTVHSVMAFGNFDERQVLHLAKLASSDSGNDPVDAAIWIAAKKKPYDDSSKVLQFIPFDPATKMAQATISDAHGEIWIIIKGAFDTVAKQIQPQPEINAVKEFEEQGCRVLGVAIGKLGDYQLVGLIMLNDTPRDDSAGLIAELKQLGIRTIMVTGDAFATARSVAQKVGMSTESGTSENINTGVLPETYAIFYGVLPEDKFTLVKNFQAQGHVVGMCGDGVNDAAALRQAQFGIAVSTASDSAKSAAGIVLTTPGLEGVVNAVRQGRITFQHILTYTLNTMTKKSAQILFLVIGLVMTGHAILTPLLMALIMITGDFLGMSLTTDHVHGSPKPNIWNIGALSIAGLAMGIGELIFCVIIFSFGLYRFSLTIQELQTLAFITIVFGNQGTTYNNRVRSYLWTTRPSNWLFFSSFTDICIASALAIYGVAMAPLPWIIVVGTLAASMLFTVLLDIVKVPMVARLGIE